jgi:primosomal protein N' (replication factor Y)
MTAAPARFRPARANAGVRAPAAVLPVARVLVDVSLAHLDRPYDYLVAEPDSAAVQPGVRVRVRFAGRLVNGYVMGRLAESDHPGRLGYIERVVSAEPVLTAEVAELARAVAERYAGSVADVLRLAVPPRHAKTEAETQPDGPGGILEMTPAASAPVSASAGVPASAGAADAHAVAIGTESTEPGLAACVPVAEVAESQPTGWRRYQAGPAFLTAIRQRRPARAVWQALPGEDWPARLADASAEAFGAGVGALLIVPDARDLARLDAALTAVLGPGRHVALSADLGPAERYRRFLAVSRGEVRIVAGTRAAVFAPVADLGLVAVFDDGDDLLAEPRAPYPHAREVLMLRSAARSCALLVGGFARTTEAQLLVESGWARTIGAQRSAVRAAAPRIEAAGDDYSTGSDSAAAKARLSPAAFAAARAALQAGAPVLIQVPRRGYVPAVACVRCRTRAQCRHCHGPLALSGPGGTLLGCRWCGQPEAHFRCAACGFDQLRAVSVGAGRTAEELGRAFPGVPVINSSGPKVRSTVPADAALVIATPGGEPVAAAGYGAALLLDGYAMLGRPDLRAGEETLRRWMAAAALVRPASAGGRVVVGADASISVVQALIRWDPVGHAAAELAGRRELGFPPAAAMASIEGDEPIVLAALDRLDLPPDGEVLGPVALDDIDDGGQQTRHQTPAQDDDAVQLRALVRVPQAGRKALGAALRAVAAGRSARKEGGGLRIRVDPSDLF